MNAYRAVALLALLATTALAEELRPAASQDDGAHRVAEAYVAATRNADVAAARALFHPGATMAGEIDGAGARVGSPEAFFRSLEAFAKTPGSRDCYVGRVESVSVEGATATAVVVEQRLAGYDFVDWLHLARVDGRWLIVSKLYAGRRSAGAGDTR